MRPAIGERPAPPVHLDRPDPRQNPTMALRFPCCVSPDFRVPAFSPQPSSAPGCEPAIQLCPSGLFWDALCLLLSSCFSLGFTAVGCWPWSVLSRFNCSWSWAGPWTRQGSSGLSTKLQRLSVLLYYWGDAVIPPFSSRLFYCRLFFFLNRLHDITHDAKSSSVLRNNVRLGQSTHMDILFEVKASPNAAHAFREYEQATRKGLICQQALK